MSPALGWRFLACYLILGGFLAAAVFGAVAFVQVHNVKHAVRQTQAALGNTDVTKAAESSVASAAASQSLTLLSQKITRVVQDPKDPNTVKVYDRIQTVQIGALTLVVTVTKGVWTVSNVAVG